MREYSLLKKEFMFLVTEYGFKIAKLTQKRGSYYFIIWEGQITEIMVLYDFTSEKPVTIRVYDADTLGMDAIEYNEEFAIEEADSPKEIIHRAAIWLRKAITEKKVIV